MPELGATTLLPRASPGEPGRQQRDPSSGAGIGGGQTSCFPLAKDGMDSGGRQSLIRVKRRNGRVLRDLLQNPWRWQGSPKSEQIRSANP